MRKLGVLRGIAIIAVIISHAAGHGMLALVGGTSPDRFLSWVGTPSYYGSISVQQLCLFAVPVFFFASGFAITYITTYIKPSNAVTLPWKVITQQVKVLLTPFGIWIAISLAPHLASAVLLRTSAGVTRLPDYVLHRIDDYYFIVIICELVLMSPLLVPIAAKYPRRALLLSAVVQFGFTILTYIAAISPSSVEWLHVPSWSPFVPWSALFYYELGMVAGFHSKALQRRLSSLNRWMGLAVLVLGALSVGESLIVRRVSQDYVSATSSQTTTVLYATAVIIALMGWEVPRGRIGQILDRLGVQSYGIYLLQALVFAGADRILSERVLPEQLLLQPLLVAAGLGIPLVMMAAVSRSPLRRYYYRAFGSHPPRLKPVATPERVASRWTVAAPPIPTHRAGG